MRPERLSPLLGEKRAYAAIIRVFSSLYIGRLLEIKTLFLNVTDFSIFPKFEGPGDGKPSYLALTLIKTPGRSKTAQFFSAFWKNFFGDGGEFVTSLFLYSFFNRYYNLYKCT